MLKSKVHCFYIQMQEQVRRATNPVKAFLAVMFTSRFIEPVYYLSELVLVANKRQFSLFFKNLYNVYINI